MSGTPSNDFKESQFAQQKEPSIFFGAPVNDVRFLQS